MGPVRADVTPLPTAEQVTPPPPARREWGHEQAWPHLLRVAAIGLVLGQHTVGSMLRHRTVFGPAWWVVVAIEALTIPAVGAFAMLSGALLLDPAKADEPVAQFFRKRAIRVGIPLVVWSVAYLVLRAVVVGDVMSPHTVASAVFLAVPYYHLYFLYMVCGLYVLTPYLRVIVARMPRSAVWLLAIIGLSWSMVGFATRLVVQVGPTENLFTWTIFYVGFFVLGQLLATVSKTRGRFWLVVLVVATAIHVGEFAGFAAWKPEWSWSPLEKYGLTTVVGAVALFMVCRSVGAEHQRRWGPDAIPSRVLRELSAASLGVYLVHPAVQLALTRRYLPMSWSTVGASRVVLFTVITVVVSLTFALVVRRIPFLRATI
jgi:surface polysaccharide O-acyltransferase-like enzyme